MIVKQWNVNLSSFQNSCMNTSNLPFHLLYFWVGLQRNQSSDLQLTTSRKRIKKASLQKSLEENSFPLLFPFQFLSLFWLGLDLLGGNLLRLALASTTVCLVSAPSDPFRLTVAAAKGCNSFLG